MGANLVIQDLMGFSSANRKIIFWIFWTFVSHFRCWVSQAESWNCYSIVDSLPTLGPLMGDQVSRDLSHKQRSCYPLNAIVGVRKSPLNVGQPLHGTLALIFAEGRIIIFSEDCYIVLQKKNVLLQDVYPLETFSNVSVPCSWGTPL